MIRELQCRDGRKSFYKKAFIIERNDGIYLKSYDTLENMILDDVEEIFPNDNIRELGLTFVKGSSLESIIPGEYEEIPDSYKDMLANDFK